LKFYRGNEDDYNSQKGDENINGSECKCENEENKK